MGADNETYFIDGFSLPFNSIQVLSNNVDLVLEG
jgi:hypothetical protein